VPGEFLAVDANLREIAVLAALACLFVVTHHVISTRIERERELESRLAGAHAEISALRARLSDATRPPTQFARAHMREVAVDRFARLRRAAPRRSNHPPLEPARDAP
jgi:anti-sigma-K factor RskA